MDTDEVWRTIDQQRLELADLMETFTADEWDTPSLCVGWRVRDVAAHLTLAQTGLFGWVGWSGRGKLQPDDPRHRRARGEASGDGVPSPVAGDGGVPGGRLRWSRTWNP